MRVIASLTQITERAFRIRVGSTRPICSLTLATVKSHAKPKSSDLLGIRTPEIASLPTSNQTRYDCLPPQRPPTHDAPNELSLVTKTERNEPLSLLRTPLHVIDSTS